MNTNVDIHDTANAATITDTVEALIDATVHTIQLHRDGATLADAIIRSGLRELNRDVDIVDGPAGSPTPIAALANYVGQLNALSCRIEGSPATDAEAILDAINTWLWNDIVHHADA